MLDGAHEQFAEELAATARKNGMTNADAIDIELEITGADDGFEIDSEEVRRRANAILRRQQ